MTKIILWAVLIGPLLTLIFLKKETLRRYMPSALFLIVLNTLFYQIAWEYNWWKEDGVFGWDKVVNIPWNYVAFPVMIIWVLKFTFERFWVYFFVNLGLDIFFSYIWYPLEFKLGLATGEIKAYQNLLILTFLSLTIYFFQSWQEGDGF
ncbi:hypothetical protein [Cytobacillus massiliigabonensis]|uniref:hypothetical protein n=1 Tax=Cytobacillus massiliigabonensis TaxID=1871011 RepID=UPI000C83C813|nr:hypothetical protein [Cytobacillus massiliigabonensis]